MIVKTVKIMPTSKEQGDFVVINEDDFDSAVHTLFKEKPEADVEMTKAELQAALDEKGITYKLGASKVELQALLTAKG